MWWKSQNPQTSSGEKALRHVAVGDLPPSGSLKFLKQQHSLYLLVLSTFWLLLLEIPIMSALVIVFVITTIVRFGRLILQASGIGAVGLGIGFVVGVGILTFAGQALLVLGVRPVLAHWLVLGVFFLICSGSRLVSWWADKSPAEVEHLEILSVLAIALFVFATRHPWLFPFSIPVLILERLIQLKIPVRKVLLTFSALIAAGAGISLAVRPEEWWTFYLNGDANHMESISWSTAHWSIFEQPGNLGGSIASYHWLGHNFYGVLSHLAFLEPWKAMMNLGVPILNIFFVGLILEPIRKNRVQPTSPQLLIVAITAIGVGIFRVDSFVFGILSALTFLAVLLRNLEVESPKAIRFALFVLLASTLTFSKATTSLAIGALILGFALFRVYRRETVPWLPIFAYFLANVLIYFAIFKDSLYSENVGRRMQFSQGILMEIVENTILFPVATVVISLFLISCLTNKPHSSQLDSYNEMTLVIFLILLGSVALGFTGFAYHQRIGTASLLLLGALLAWRLLTKLEVLSGDLKVSPTTLTLYFLIFIVITLASTVFPIIVNRVATFAELNTTTPANELLLRLIRTRGLWILIIAIGVVFASNIKIPLRASKPYILITLSFAVIVGSQFDNTRRVLSWGSGVYRNWPANDSPFPTQDLSDVGTFIRTHTPAGAVLASNNFCCFGNEWWNNITNQIKDSGQSSLPMYEISSDWVAHLPPAQQAAVVSISWGGDNYQTLAVTRRRFLMQGLPFQFGAYDRPSPEQLDRMTLSLDFANQPTASTAQSLKAYGVSGYLVNLKLTKVRDWSMFGTVKFAAGDFAYIELK